MRDKSVVNEGSYDDLKVLLDESVENQSKEIIQSKPAEKKELVYDKLEKKEKLSNNKINELKAKAKEIEEELEFIDDELSKDFEDYMIIDKLSDRKSELESEYFKILETLENN